MAFFKPPEFLAVAGFPPLNEFPLEEPQAKGFS
jgi:hypothetical protein